MTTTQPQPHPRSRAVVAALVDAGFLDPVRATEADLVVSSALGAAPPGAGSLGRRMAEVAGYVGGAFVLGAGMLFFANSWSDLSLGQRVGLLLVISLVLVAAGGVLAATAGGRAALRSPSEAVRRRLTSVLLTGAAGSAAFGVGLLLGDRMDNQELGVMLAAGVGLVVALAGYLLAPTTVGQLGAAVAAFVMVPSGTSGLSSGDGFSAVLFGAIVLAIGVLWLLATGGGLWQEVLSGRVIGLTLALVGAQIPIVSEHEWVGYLLTGLVGVVAFGGYLVTRSWPYLTAGVIGLTVAVPEAVNDFSGGSFGAAGLLLLTGVTLLVAALLGLRLRQEVKDQQPA
ncbi:MAG: hypothetical protein ACR2HA_01370 [Nocardioides sp.]